MKKRKDSLARQEQVLMNELKMTKLALESAYSNFENAVDPDLIDCCIYEVNAVQHRYKFLLRQAKKHDELTGQLFGNGHQLPAK